MCTAERLVLASLMESCIGVLQYSLWLVASWSSCLIMVYIHSVSEGGVSLLMLNN
jgi:hypothetical protein